MTSSFLSVNSMLLTLKKGAFMCTCNFIAGFKTCISSVIKILLMNFHGSICMKNLQTATMLK